MFKTNIICLVPVKNEAWILKNFIECAQAWADCIIVGDNHSTDNSVEIARSYKNVSVIDIGSSFDEHNRRNLLLNEARKIPGRRLIFCLDADEMISANWSQSHEWDLMVHAEPGTQFQFDLVEIFPELKKGALLRFLPVIAFVDDGSEFSGVKMHSPRIPVTTGEVINVDNIKWLHYIMIEPERMFSKHRWYKCFEFVENKKRPWPICIMYQDTKIKSYDAPLVDIHEEWISGYSWLEEYRQGRITERCYWYDEEVLNFFDTYGVKKFSKLNIWDVNWSNKAKLLRRTGTYDDPRSWFERRVHHFIETHREELKVSRSIFYRGIRLFGKTVLRVFGW